MPGTFAKVKTVVLIVTAPVWLPLWCLSMPFIVWLYFLYIVTTNLFQTLSTGCQLSVRVACFVYLKRRSPAHASIYAISSIG